MTDALVIGGGPAGLMAADALLSAGRAVTLVDAKPSFGRKFLMAGKSGLNLTNMQNAESFLKAYGNGQIDPILRECLLAFGPTEVKAWAESLDQSTFTGTTGRLFPNVMKASPLLRAWLARLDTLGLSGHTKWRWLGWDKNACFFDTPEGQRVLTPRVTVFAMGGASWSRLGSDGHWAEQFEANGVEMAPFQPSNSGLAVAWSPHMAKHFGAPLKNIALVSGSQFSRGEVVISKRGIEGGGIYSLSSALRDSADLTIDLLPDLTLDKIAKRLGSSKGKSSLSNHLRRTLKLTPPAQAILREFVSPLPADHFDLAKCLKAVPIKYSGLRPMDEAISTAGGVTFDALDETLMLRDRPGTFCAGEMLDWDAPTGGYLLNACLATGLWAGRHASDYDSP